VKRRPAGLIEDLARAIHVEFVHRQIGIEVEGLPWHECLCRGRHSVVEPLDDRQRLGFPVVVRSDVRLTHEINVAALELSVENGQIGQYRSRSHRLLQGQQERLLWLRLEAQMHDGGRAQNYP
jgi:hypothetical protein